MVSRDLGVESHSNSRFSLKKIFSGNDQSSVSLSQSQTQKTLTKTTTSSFLETNRTTKKLISQSSNPFCSTPSSHPTSNSSSNTLHLAPSNGLTSSRSSSLRSPHKSGASEHTNSLSRSSSTKHRPASRNTNQRQQNSIHANSSTTNTLLRNSPGLPSASLTNEHIVYNPYGLNPNLSRPGTTTVSASSSFNKDISFYMHDGDAKIRLLPLPISDPNEYIPSEMKQYSVHLTDNFVFDTDNKTIGSGGSSEVRKVKSAYKQKQIYALKKLNMIYNETPEKFYKRCSKEFIIAKSLSNDIHIANTYYLVKVPTSSYTTRGWGFIMELCTGDLFQLIERTGWKNVPLPEKFCIFKQIVEGIKFCHDNGIAHRDLKPENVLISKDGIFKLTDFGISDWYHEDPHDFSSPVKRCEGMIGSPPYAPPEVMYFDAKKHYPEHLQLPYNPLGLDCYALGILLFTLVNNTIPFFESCNTDTRFRSYETSYNNFISYQNKFFRSKGSYKPGPGAEYSLGRNFRNVDASRVAWRLADPQYETRYTLDDLLEDPWFKSIETCVHSDDEYVHTPPQIQKTSLEHTGGFYLGEVDSSKEDFTSDSHPGTNPMSSALSTSSAGSSAAGTGATSNPFLTTKKSRSMVEIANSPQSKAVTKTESRSSHEDKEQGLFTLDENEEGKENEENKENEETKEKEEEVELGNLINDKSETPIPIVPSVTNRNSELSLQLSPSNGQTHYVVSNQLPRTISSSSSIRSSGSKNKKKRVIHNHLSIPNSVSSIPSSARSFSDR
ncbi:hypothetical protein Kpol_529p18 [Vanderwaltozyma polyspora DSM 70294]|uniref:non-specific serine/threonine protein kinase n=1 Tax=Vanderwaltozyma polyspora (strain ATCC 22028 / DSM 70294 / BCRC 21397 / CBS 2163 / NBRC 10782 / NRRL Y-8283 / UCD 57-17) TaxID=436907 RepID=A7TM71_VANPO|nr:uncharacterized protein Kpol_529p18 [Vanderwaltozyma polyspora DSM 70294]EDO16638.1 hypothetical protein Kpol_529p18 [Vanderwaltozyma polyspora DSM 70294]